MYTLQEHAYNHIREKLLVGDLGPPGSRVSDVKLAELIGISRTPVREAINQLVSEGLLERRPRAGVFVKVPDRRELEELYELREVVESYAVEKSASRISQEDLQELHNLCAEMKEIIDDFETSKLDTIDDNFAMRWFASDSAYHLLLLRASGNRQAIRIANDLRIMTQILGHRRIDHTLEDLKRIYEEHHKIVQLITEGKGKQARTRMARHVNNSKRETLQSLARRESGAGKNGSEQEDWPEPLRHLIYRIETMFSAKPGEKVSADFPGKKQ